MTQPTDSDREARNSLLKLIDCMGDDDDCWHIDQSFALYRAAFEQSIRDKALEEAAVVAEDFDTWPMDGPAVRTNIAALIRQMKGEG